MENPHNCNMIMKKHELTKIYFIAAALAMLLAILPVSFAFAPDPVYADDTYTVTFYSKTDKSEVIDTQQVKQGGHPVQPVKKLPDYEEGGFRYSFDKWYWIVDGSPMDFSLTADDCEIWSDTELYASYAQYLAEGYELIVTHKDGTEFITDTSTPLTELLKEYDEVTSVYTQSERDYVEGSDIISDSDEKEVGNKTVIIAVVIVTAIALASALVIISKRKTASKDKAE